MGRPFSVFDAPFDFAHLTLMTVDEFSSPRKTELLPELPRLTTLHVLLASCGHHLDACRQIDITEPSIFFSSGRGWACPSLRNVQFAHRPLQATAQAETCVRMALGRAERWSYCYCTVALTISLCEVHNFLITSLDYERDRLEELRLTGVEPVDAVMEHLYELADEVVITSVPELNASQDHVDCSSCANSFM